MSDLTDFRDHARRLSQSPHRDDCELIHRITKVDRWMHDHDLDVTLSCSNTDGHEPHGWVATYGYDYSCPGLCDGCSTEAERELWARLADEIDGYLTPTEDGPDLFGGDA